MKLAITFLLLLSSPLFAKKDDREILKCLGAEEKRFHLKKEGGPVYDLNQRLISELIQIPGVEVSREAYLAVCSGKNFSESMKLLELSLKLGKSIFIIPKDVQGMQRSIVEGMIDDYIDASKDVLLSLVAGIQTQAPTPTCLKEEVPELDAFFIFSDCFLDIFIFFNL
jgi:hypothetical protein